MSRTKHHGKARKDATDRTCLHGGTCKWCEENRRRAGEKDRKEAEMKQKEERETE